MLNFEELMVITYIRLCKNFEHYCLYYWQRQKRCSKLFSALPSPKTVTLAVPGRDINSLL